MTSPWWRSFHSQRDTQFFCDSGGLEVKGVRDDLIEIRRILSDEKALDSRVEYDTETGRFMRRDELAEVRKTLSDSLPLWHEPEPEVIEKPTKLRRALAWLSAIPPGERICWTAVVFLLAWLAWAVTHAALYAPA